MIIHLVSHLANNRIPTILHCVICVMVVLSFRCARLQCGGRTSLLLW